MSMERESLIFNFDFCGGSVCEESVCVCERNGKGRAFKEAKKK